MNEFENPHHSPEEPQRSKPMTVGAADAPITETAEACSGQEHTVFLAHRKDRQVIPGLRLGHGIMTVQKWDSTKRAYGWTLTGAQLTLDRGRPFGAFWYRHDGGRVVRVGVRWNHDVEQLECICLHPHNPELADNLDAAEANRIELDARSRVATLVAVNAEIGSFVATRTSEEAILDASGLGLKRL